MVGSIRMPVSASFLLVRLVYLFETRCCNFALTLKLGSLTSKPVLLGVIVRLCTLGSHYSLSACLLTSVIFFRKTRWFRWRGGPAC